MKVLSLLMHACVTQAIRFTGSDGLVHNADGSTSFPGGGKVSGVGVMVDSLSFKGPKPSEYTSENGAAMKVVDIVKH